MSLSPARVVRTCIATVFVLAVAFAGHAGAATYTVWSCRGPDGAPTSTAAWEAIVWGGTTADDCATGGSMSGRLLRSDEALVRGFRFAPPAGADVVGYRIHLFATTVKMGSGGVLQAGIEEDTAFAPVQVDAGCPVVGCTFGVTDPPLSAGNLISVSGLEAGGLNVVVACTRIQGCTDPDSDRVLAEVRMFRSEVDVRDDEPPLVGAAQMPADGQLLSASTIVRASAGDTGGGVAVLALLVDGSEVARRDAGGTCRQPYSLAAPCPGELDEELALDPASLAQGTHTMRVRAVDAAGNESTSAAVSFRVGAASAVLASPSVVERLVPVPTPSSARRVTIKLSRRMVRLPDTGAGIAGVVKDTAGRPLSGVKVTVRSRPFGVRRLRMRTERTLTTDTNGRFAMPAGRTSRLVVFDVNDGVLRAVDQAEVSVMQRLRVSAQTGARFLSNGSAMKLRVNVSGAGGGAEAKAVLVQAFVEGRWTTVDSISANARGQATWRYRFRATTRRTVYRFRVKVERAGDVWPWPTTTSSFVRVVVFPS